MSRGRMSTATLLKSHGELWSLVVDNPYVFALRDGSLPESTLEHWLVQSRFVGESIFLTLADCLQRGPSEHRAFLIECLERNHETLVEYDRQIAQRRLARRRVELSATRAFRDFTRSLAFEPYVCSLLVLWGQYRAYVNALSAAKLKSRKFSAFARRVRAHNAPQIETRLRGMVNRLLVTATAEEKARAENVFVRHAHLRIEFWSAILEHG